MIPLGKTHMVEFAFGGWGRNRPMGAPWNPWDATTHRVAGGSSSGSAVAVAGAVRRGDRLGHRRIDPHSRCALRHHGVEADVRSSEPPRHGAASSTLDSIGPLARPPRIAGLLTAAMATADPHDPATLDSPRGDLEAALAAEPDVRGMRITALAPEVFPAFTQTDVVRAYREAIDVLRDLGARGRRGPFPLDFDEMMVQNGKIIAAEAYAVHREYIEDPKLDIDPWVKKRVLAGKSVSAADYTDMLEQRRRMSAEFAALDGATATRS